MDEQLAIARKNANTNKTAAKKALERKRVFQGYRDQTEGYITTLEQQIYAIESANINRETLGAMERAASAMSQIHGKLTPEKVDETMDKLREQNALGEEIVEAMNSINSANQVDVEDLDAELEELQQEQLDEQILKLSNVSVPGAVHGMPAAARGEHASKAPMAEEEDEDTELRQLQAEMAM
ncbi:ESCRT-III subunit protein snf7 [Conoideocrella luteorostrata]|uniref:Vacuolar-sorting protein SNF7 n=1 Tax=Conoideocrella luteorostrata TaxID=1105319 RepID=A0AAJ0FV25_9HYPO|nr:ESCRT-III subunit protein snf7 [Conoideocrella luteorostrata]